MKPCATAKTTWSHTRSGRIAELHHSAVSTRVQTSTVEFSKCFLNMRSILKTALTLLVLCVLTGGAALAQAQNLESVLNSMDQAAASFRTAQADFVWDQYQKVVDDHDFQKGTMYFRHQGGDIEMAADITSPIAKYVLFHGDMVSVYQPSIDQITEYNAGKNKSDFESFLVLGFGGRGHDLAKSFDVSYAGTEQLQGG